MSGNEVRNHCKVKRGYHPRYRHDDYVDKVGLILPEIGQLDLLLLISLFLLL